MSGGMASFCSCPIEVCLVRMQVRTTILCVVFRWSKQQRDIVTQVLSLCELSRVRVICQKRLLAMAAVVFAVATVLQLSLIHI